MKGNKLQLPLAQLAQLTVRSVGVYEMNTRALDPAVPELAG